MFKIKKIAFKNIYPLAKKRNIKQALLKLEERKKIINNLEVVEQIKKEERIILVDDIISSGSTLLAAKELLGLGNVEILVLLWNHLEDFRKN